MPSRQLHGTLTLPAKVSKLTDNTEGADTSQPTDSEDELPTFVSNEISDSDAAANLVKCCCRYSCVMANHFDYGTLKDWYCSLSSNLPLSMRLFSTSVA